MRWFGEIQKTLGLWTRNVVECCKSGLMGHPRRGMEGSNAESYVDCGGQSVEDGGVESYVDCEGPAQGTSCLLG